MVSSFSFFPCPSLGFTIHAHLRPAYWMHPLLPSRSNDLLSLGFHPLDFSDLSQKPVYSVSKASGNLSSSPRVSLKPLTLILRWGTRKRSIPKEEAAGMENTWTLSLKKFSISSKSLASYTATHFYFWMLKSHGSPCSFSIYFFATCMGGLEYESRWHLFS